MIGQLDNSLVEFGRRIHDAVEHAQPVNPPGNDGSNDHDQQANAIHDLAIGLENIKLQSTENKNESDLHSSVHDVIVDSSNDLQKPSAHSEQDAPLQLVPADTDPSILAVPGPIADNSDFDLSVLFTEIELGDQNMLSKKCKAFLKNYLFIRIYSLFRIGP